MRNSYNDGTVGSALGLMLRPSGRVGAMSQPVRGNRPDPFFNRRPCPQGFHYNSQGSCVPNVRPGGVHGVGAMARSYVVKPGDNIFVIARKFGMPNHRASDLLKANSRRPMVNKPFGPDFASLPVGTTLAVPVSWPGGGMVNGPSGMVGAAYNWTPTIPGVCLAPGSYWDDASEQCVIGCPVGWSFGGPTTGCVQDAPNCVQGAPCDANGLPGVYNNACNCEVLPGQGSLPAVDCAALTGRSDCWPDPNGPGGCMCPEASTQVNCYQLTGRSDCYPDANAPGGCACPVDCSQFGAGYEACGGACTFCGPNATVNPGDCGCDCLPGMVPNPSGVEGSGCVMAQPGPDGTQPIDTGGGGGPPPVQTGNTATAAPAESSNTGMIILGLAAVAAVGYGAYAVSKKRLRTSFDHKESRP